MQHRTTLPRWIAACALGAAAAVCVPHAAAEAVEVQTEAAPAKPQPDLSGRRRVGKASFYAQRFAGRKMADGTPMDPLGANAASRTLPLGTTARVINLETGRSAIVTIQDRGPYVDGRIVDLSPATAEQIGLGVRQGLARVAVVPIAVPLPNGRVKLGEAAHDIEANNGRFAGSDS